MTELRTFTEADVLPLDKLWREHWTNYSLPNRENRIIDSVAVNNGQIIGYGQVKLFAEVMLFLDPTARKRDRARALKLLMLEAFRGADKAGIEELYAFIKDPDFSLLIQKRYGFKRIIEPGELLLRKL
jgi:hypothetical protein